MKYLKLFAAVLASIFTFSLSQAQEKIKLENSVLWKIEHTELEKPSYILGTLHVMCEEDFNIPEKVTNTLLNVDALVLEVNFSDPKEMQSFQESMSNPTKISEELSEEQYRKLDQLVTKIAAMPLSTYDAYGLSMLNAILLPNMLPCSEIKLLENELTLLATKNKKPIFALEKVSQQMELMKNAYPTEFALKQLMLFESYKKDFNNAIIAYKNEDISTAVGLISKEDYMDENATTIMQINRNKDWVEKMPEMMKERSNLFAVGAAHLTEDYGIIHLLRTKGYTVTAVSN
ncbi:lipoprotein [Salinimicrobium marinum]|uniref:Lipoprotein n=1 Tax=Salinimicrobium marinum TaxID=680283 RepID=A0A918SL35_9FLAO|nr:TraB/GumN family protein [Salinimicrobium marinum]GHA48533.1 lipoprotein [Salinimicrobium marinum]